MPHGKILSRSRNNPGLPCVRRDIFGAASRVLQDFSRRGVGCAGRCGFQEGIVQNGDASDQTGTSVCARDENGICGFLESLCTLLYFKCERFARYPTGIPELFSGLLMTTAPVTPTAQDPNHVKYTLTIIYSSTK